MYVLNNISYSKAELVILASFQLQNPALKEWERELYLFILEWLSDNEYIIVKTSGSTGIPKEIQFAKRQMELSAKRSIEFFQLKEGDKALLCLPVRYIAGMMMVVRAFIGRLNLITTDPSNIDSFESPIDFAALVPLQIENMIQTSEDINIFKQIIIGGSPLSEKHSHFILNNYSGQAWETYGMTETITHVALRNIKSDSTFKALTGIEFSKDDRNCLIIHDPLIQKEPVITNDCVELLSNKEFTLIGRVDNVINSGGIKVQPEEIEAFLISKTHQMCCISSIDDEKLGQKIVLVLENDKHINDFKKAIEEIDLYKRPKQIVVIDSFPLNLNQKIDRQELRNKITRV